jgi:CBS domain-containing protein
MQLKDVMTRTVKTVPSTATVQEAARLMEQYDVGFLPVIQDDISAGVVTDRDLAIRVVAAGRDPAQTTVADVMSFGPGVGGDVDMTDLPGVATLPEDTTLVEALEFMDQKQIRRVTVHDKCYRIVGIVSRADLPGVDHMAHGTHGPKG